ncbi:hypothetical protein FNV43_RR14922 [Rhamnella rubrinervis]|uniref:Cytochrome P450 n=1 Tax=Rhamnella rubrinervis TaxID=2594499 RepID=A0A8K0H492_9ROSA|nr:hypothetical protein FNV43_RR14922 [Rhamnella rubrinervis]
MAMEILAVICLLFLLLLIHHWRKQRNAAIPTNWPIFGMMPGLVQNIPRVHDFATEALKSSGGTEEIKGPWFANFDFWVTCDPTNMHYILNTNFANYPKGPEFQKMFEPFGYGIINSESHLWKNQRKMLLSIIGHTKFESYMEKTFERKVLHGLIPVLDHVSKARIKVDLQDVFQRLTFDNISILVLGIDPLSLSIDFPNVAYKNAFDDVEEMIFRRHFKPETLWKLQRWLQIGGEKKLTKSLKVLMNSYTNP